MESLSTEHAESAGTNVRRFLAQRGAVVIKETRDIGTIRGQYSDAIKVSTVVLAIVKGENRTTSYGCKFERMEGEDRTTSSVFLDFDEIDELMEAFNFIGSTAVDLALQQRDYTEITYSTKDKAQFGFYQQHQEQQAFIALQSHGGTTFLPVGRFTILKGLLTSAKAHLESRGAAIV